MKPIRILMTGNTSFKLANFRATLIRRLVRDGHEVIALVPVDGHSDALAQMGCRIVPLRMSRKGRNPLEELRLFFDIWRVIGREKPDIVFGFTIKNNIYGALAARWHGLPFLPNVTGLGTAFCRSDLLNRTVVALYRLAFARVTTVFVQNDMDQTVLERAGAIRPGQAVLLPGSGVDLDRFRALPPPDETPAGPEFILIARMLRDKGVEDFARAAGRLHRNGVKARFSLLGPLDPDNPGALKASGLDRLSRDHGVRYLGETCDVRPYLARAACVVLPSFYREGTPRILLEAAATARPIITTDTPGCRDTVEDGTSGYLVPPHDVAALAQAMTGFLDLCPQRREAMGHAARGYAATRFDEAIVVDAYLRQLRALGLVERIRIVRTWPALRPRVPSDG